MSEKNDTPTTLKEYSTGDFSGVGAIKGIDLSMKSGNEHSMAVDSEPPKKAVESVSHTGSQEEILCAADRMAYEYALKEIQAKATLIEDGMPVIRTLLVIKGEEKLFGEVLSNEDSAYLALYIPKMILRDKRTIAPGNILLKFQERDKQIVDGSSVLFFRGVFVSIDHVIDKPLNERNNTEMIPLSDYLKDVQYSSIPFEVFQGETKNHQPKIFAKECLIPYHPPSQNETEKLLKIFQLLKGCFARILEYEKNKEKYLVEERELEVEKKKRAVEKENFLAEFLTKVNSRNLQQLNVEDFCSGLRGYFICRPHNDIWKDKDGKEYRDVVVAFIREHEDGSSFTLQGPPYLREFMTKESGRFVGIKIFSRSRSKTLKSSVTEISSVKEESEASAEESSDESSSEVIPAEEAEEMEAHESSSVEEKNPTLSEGQDEKKSGINWASGAARELAESHPEVDFSSIQGSGVDGKLNKGDVERHLKEKGV